MLPEREPHPRLDDAMRIVLEAIDHDELWPALMVRWEMGLLDELGFGLDLSKCASTGQVDGPVYVSPKSGKAVSGGRAGPTMTAYSAAGIPEGRCRPLRRKCARA